MFKTLKLSKLYFKYNTLEIRDDVIEMVSGIPILQYTDENSLSCYYDSLNNLKEIIEICDEINIYENTEMFREIIDF